MGEVLTRPAGYDGDFYLWTQEQAQALRAAEATDCGSCIDWENIVDEIESLGKRDCRSCGNFTSLILVLLVKLKYFPLPELRREWQRQIGTYRYRLKQILRDSPTLAARMPALVCEEKEHALATVFFDAEEYPAIAKLAERLAASFPFTHCEVLDRTFSPDYTEEP